MSTVVATTFAQSPAPPLFTPAAPVGTGQYPRAVTAGDFNGDGRPDLAVANFVGNNLTVLLNTTMLATSTGLISSVNPSTLGQAVVFTATVSASQGTPAGTVTFKDEASNLGLGTLNARSAIFTTSALAAGSHLITAVYISNDDRAFSKCAAKSPSPPTAFAGASIPAVARRAFGGGRLGSATLGALRRVVQLERNRSQAADRFRVSLGGSVPGRGAY